MKLSTNYIVIPPETNATNPQFRIHIPNGHPSKAHVVVAVAQKYDPIKICYNFQYINSFYLHNLQVRMLP